jgi:antitoxin HicB
MFDWHSSTLGERMLTTIDATIEQRVQELLKLPYRKVIRGDAQEGFLAEAPELPGCFTAGETEEEALEMLREAMAAWIESALIDGDPVPEPTPDPAHSGRVLVRMPKSLHRCLAERAKEEGVSLNQMAVTILARGLA